MGTPLVTSIATRESRGVTSWSCRDVTDWSCREFEFKRRASKHSKHGARREIGMSRVFGGVLRELISDRFMSALLCRAFTWRSWTVGGAGRLAASSRDIYICMSDDAERNGRTRGCNGAGGVGHGEYISVLYVYETLCARLFRSQQLDVIAAFSNTSVRSDTSSSSSTETNGGAEKYIFARAHNLVTDLTPV